MPEENTRADSLGRFLTGATTHSGTQTDPDASIGNHQSSTRIVETTVNVVNPISDISVDRVSADNGAGAGSLTATATDAVAWTPPGGSQGTAVTIANGETKLVEGSGDPTKFIVVTRNSATSLTGTATVNITIPVNALFDDKTSAEASAGDIDYRCECVENLSASQMTNTKVWIGTLGTQRTTDTTQLPASGAGTIETTGSFSDWPTEGFAAVKDSGGTLREAVYYTSRTPTVLTVPAAGRAMLGSSAAAGTATDTVDAVPGIAIALDAPTAQPSGNFEAPADEATPPTGPTFSTPYTETDALSIGTLNANEIYGVWYERQFPASSTSTPSADAFLKYKFDAA